MLVVEDDALLGPHIEKRLRRFCQVEVAETRSAAERALDARKFDAAVVDLQLPDGSGEHLLPLLRREQSSMPVVVISGGDVGVASAIAFAYRAYFLPKHHVSKLAFDLAPLALLASAYAQRLTSEKEVLRTATLGFALPVGASLFVMSAINFATSQSSLYQPSLTPNIAMALWGGSAASAKTGPAMIALLTTFGAFRFGIRSIPTIIPNPRFHLPAVFTILALSLANLAWGEYTKQVTFPPDFDPPAVVLAIVTAILSADALHNRPTESKQIDWPATTALIAAFAVAYSIAQSGNPALNPWWRPWIFPSYLTAFTITLAGRKLQRPQMPTNRP